VNRREKTPPSTLWDRTVCEELITQLNSLRADMLAREADLQAALTDVLPPHRDSARNLIHYLSLRGHDLRALQEQLAWLGLSSLGRSESHVLANLDKVLGLLHRLMGRTWHDLSAQEPLGRSSSREQLQHNTDSLLGIRPAQRAARIMVTLPAQAADDVGLVRELVEAGMDIARINCAHDGPQEWRAMAAHVRKTAKKARRSVRILMDLGGPKIRTADIAPGPAALKLKPGKDELGNVHTPARLGLQPMGQHEPMADVQASVGVWAHWLERLKVGSTITFVDARGARRHLVVTRCNAQGAVAECLRTAYLTSETVLVLEHAHGKKKHSTLVCHIERTAGALRLAPGDGLLLTRPQGTESPDDEFSQDACASLPRVSCTLGAVIDQVKVGERVWFDDGRIGAVVRQVLPDALEVEITHARAGGDKLAADKGINFPDSSLDLPSLTAQDVDDLAEVAQLADLVALSFVQKPQDIAELRQQLRALQRDDLGLVLKIETRQGFERLPDLMLAAMAAPQAGIMIARGDLAVECGFERMAEVQEEILCCAEAAHLPVIWATQVLESLVKDGLPSRAEISDAGLGVRAECVMLNKGPHIVHAIRTLDDILQRMSAHQDKKRTLLRALQSWQDCAAPQSVGRR